MLLGAENMAELREIRKSLLEDPRRKAANGSACEGQEFEEHQCAGSLIVWPVIFPWPVIECLPQPKRSYFWSEMNCSLVCYRFTKFLTKRKRYRRWFIARLSSIYGGPAVLDYMAQAPEIDEYCWRKARWGARTA